MNSSDLFRRAVGLARAGKKDAARDAFIRLVDEDPNNEFAWMWLAGLVDSHADKIIACENVLTINPSNEKARAYLGELNRRMGSVTVPGEIKKKAVVHRKNRKDPLEEAKYLEQEGKFDEALMIYKIEAAKASTTRVFEEIERQIARIEKRQHEKIEYITPHASIIRMSFVWPLLYLSLALVQVGLEPFSHPTSYLWFAFPWVAAGGYLVAVAEVHSRHLIWQKIFREHGDGSVTARLIVALAGWLMILIPLGLIVFDSINRLSKFLST